MDIDIELEIDGPVTHIAEQRIKEIEKRADEIFCKLINEEMKKILLDGAREGEWLFDIVYEAMLGALSDNVYAVYTPKVYNRRYTAPDGLASMNSVELAVDIGANKIDILNTASYNSCVQLNIPLATFINSGSVYPNPRRFYDKIPLCCDAQRLKEELTRRVMERAGDIANTALTSAIRGE